ncbi:MAG: 4-hydroxybenzoyl-CoA thioesterase [Candidatus Endobugula sp.]|jgi:4-hydroxybenzoyl-CoA thioesterase
MSKEFQLPIRVYIEDTDAGGIVYYVNYLKYLERSRTELLRSLGYGKTAILEEGLLLVVHSLDAQYLAPARLDDEVLATATITKLARSYIVFQQEVRIGKQVLCRANTKIACVSDTMKPQALPSYIHQSVQVYLS